MTRWIVDGMNVIGSRPTGWWRDRLGAKRDLLGALDRFAAESGEEVTVVFDGAPFDPDAPRGTAGGSRVSVLFASRSGRNAADDDIAAMVAADRDPGSFLVVTSDGDLARRVRDAGAAVLGAGEFRRRLDV